MNTLPEPTKETEAATPDLPAQVSAARTRRSPVAQILVFSIAGGVAMAVWQFGVRPRMHAAAELKASTEAAQTKTVSVQHPVAQPAESDLLLPGSVQPFRQATLYARTSGYIKQWMVDIGDSVKEGQLLAEIDTPEVDQQLAHAKAALDQSKAAWDLAKLTLARWQEMAKSQVVSVQSTDEKVTAEKSASANFAAAKANLDQLEEMEKFKKIVAPFDGTITERMIDVGSLISSGNTPTELYRISQDNQLRVMVNVPQAYMRAIAVGMKAELVTREFGSRTFAGCVGRTSRAIDPQSRTLLTEVEVPNEDGSLVPGMYAEVRFEVANTEPAVLVPASALVIRAAGPMVIVADPATQKIAFRHVQLGHDLGSQVEVTKGVGLKDLVVTTPTDDLTDGMTVELKQPNKVAVQSEPKKAGS